MNVAELERIIGVRGTCPDRRPHLWRVVRYVPRGDVVDLRVECIRSCCAAGLETPAAPIQLLALLGLPCADIQPRRAWRLVAVVVVGLACWGVVLSLALLLREILF